MSLFKVEWEEEGPIVKAPGISERVLKSFNHYYVSHDLKSVWEALEYIRVDPERRLISIMDCSVGVTVLKSADQP